ncbi:hypothetical protein EXIGLDRAFT_768865 [Exidia glandulosa HHB12029]|uniref:Uncharacterized protein n=1 Tax=Exidia glandulosa HHB12029 TaxID=1314781 RepID=A0A165HW14_EXIGL|nr:hypothetical protein EXIGLDRAFT_768865 [Exidia glandulosa HHB12029]
MASTTFEPVILVVANPAVDTSDPVFLSRKEHEKFAVWKAEDDAIADKSVSRVNAALASVIALGKRNLKADPSRPSICKNPSAREPTIWLRSVPMAPTAPGAEELGSDLSDTFCLLAPSDLMYRIQ